MLESQLKNYNLLLDKLHTSTSDRLEEEQLLQQAQTLKLKNEAEKKKVDSLYTETSLWVLDAYRRLHL